MPAPAIRCACRARTRPAGATTRCARSRTVRWPARRRAPAAAATSAWPASRRPPAATSARPAAGQVYCTQFVMPAPAEPRRDRPRSAPAGSVRGRRLDHVLRHARAGDPGRRLDLGAHHRGQRRHLHAARHAAQLPGHRRVRRRHRRPERDRGQRRRPGDPGPDLPRVGDDRRQDPGRHLHAGRRPGRRRRAESLGHAVRDDRREPGRQSRAAASPPRTRVPSRSAPGCGPPRRRPAC